jgi:DNA-binding response OmpR family regulator
MGAMRVTKCVSAKVSVVVLEDDPPIRELLQRWLAEAGYDVAVDAAPADIVPALVIADVADPQCADERIGSLRAVYAAAILLVSARFRRGLAGSAEAAHRLGVEKVLPKPFTRQELLAAVRESLAA